MPAGDLSAEMKRLFDLVSKQNASDLLISAGSPPAVRVNGEILRTKGEPLSAEQTRKLIYDLLTADQRATASLWATECTDVARCLGATSRVWVVAADNLDPPYRANPTNQLRYEVKAALGPFVQLAVWRVNGFTITLFVRPPRV